MRAGARIGRVNYSPRPNVEGSQNLPAPRAPLKNCKANGRADGHDRVEFADSLLRRHELRFGAIGLREQPLECLQFRKIVEDDVRTIRMIRQIVLVVALSAG